MASNKTNVHFPKILTEKFFKQNTFNFDDSIVQTAYKKSSKIFALKKDMMDMILVLFIAMPKFYPFDSNFDPQIYLMF